MSDKCPKHGVWRYRLYGNPQWLTFTGTPITREQAMGFLLMHYNRSKILDLEPGGKI